MESGYYEADLSWITGITSSSFVDEDGNSGFALEVVQNPSFFRRVLGSVTNLVQPTNMLPPFFASAWVERTAFMSEVLQIIGPSIRHEFDRESANFFLSSERCFNFPSGRLNKDAFLAFFGSTDQANGLWELLSHAMRCYEDEVYRLPEISEGLEANIVRGVTAFYDTAMSIKFNPASFIFSNKISAHNNFLDTNEAALNFRVRFFEDHEHNSNDDYVIKSVTNPLMSFATGKNLSSMKVLNGSMLGAYFPVLHEKASHIINSLVNPSSDHHNLYWNMHGLETEFIDSLKIFTMDFSKLFQYKTISVANNTGRSVSSATQSDQVAPGNRSTTATRNVRSTAKPSISSDGATSFSYRARRY